MAYTITESNPAPGPGGAPNVQRHELGLQLRVDSYEEDESSGWAMVQGRISIGHCLLSAPVMGQVFRGDALSQVAGSRLSLTAGGESDLGQMVAVRVTGARQADGVVNGQLTFISYDKRPPCAMENLTFSMRVAP